MILFFFKKFSQVFDEIADAIIADEYLELRENEWKDVNYTDFNLS